MTTVTAQAAYPRLGVRRATRILAIANLVGQIGIVFTGGWVRLTASGLGCSTWPQCEPGQFTPRFHEATSNHAFIEFGNRTVTGLLTIIGVALAIACWGERGRSRAFRLFGLVPLVGVAAQAVIGGITVLMHLNPAIVSSHMLVSLALVAASAYLVVRTREGDAPPHPLVPRLVARLGQILALLAAAVVVLGVVTTGAGPHSGDDEVAYRFALDPARMAQVHAAAVWAFIAIQAVMAWQVWRVTPPQRAVRRAAMWLVLLTLAQGALGYIQYLTDLPAALVAFHMLAAALIVAAVTWYLLTLRARPALDAAADSVRDSATSPLTDTHPISPSHSGTADQ